MSVYVETHTANASKNSLNKLITRLWAALILIGFGFAVAVVARMPFGRQFIALYRQPIFLALNAFILLQFIAVGLHAFINPKSRKSIRNKIILVLFSLVALPFATLGFQTDFAHMFGQTGVAMQQCFGPASAPFSSAIFPQLACLQAWDTPYAVVERRKIAEYSQKECLKQEDQKISGNIEQAMDQFNAFDPKDKIVAAFRENHVPLETVDGQSYFANIHTHCLDGAGYDKNAQFKVVVLASFTAGSLLRDVTVSASNASSFTTIFAANGVAESYHIDFESKRRVASIANNISSLLFAKVRSSADMASNVSLSNLSLSCTDSRDICRVATLSGTLLNRSEGDIKTASIGWGVIRNGSCDQSINDQKTIAFDPDHPLRNQEQRSFSLSVTVPNVENASLRADLCGTVLHAE